MFRIIFCMCWQTKNKTCLVYVLSIAQGVCFKLQVRTDCKKEESKSAKLDRLKIRFDQSRITENRLCRIF